MKLSTIMKPFPKTVLRSDTLDYARDVMVRGGFRHLPVLDKDEGRVIGVITEGDIARHRAETSEVPWNGPIVPVEAAMTSKPHTAGPDDSLSEAAARMANEHISCLPITKRGKLVGLLTTADVLAAEVRVDTQTKGPNGVRVGDVMTPNPQTVHPDDHLLDGAARMSQYRVRHLPVIDGEQHIVGMLSDRDVRASIGDPAKSLAPESSVSAKLLHVRDAMSKPAIVVNVNESCTEVARALAELRASTVPVADENNTLVGILSYVDLLRAFAA